MSLLYHLRIKKSDGEYQPLDCNRISMKTGECMGHFRKPRYDHPRFYTCGMHKGHVADCPACWERNGGMPKGEHQIDAGKMVDATFMRGGDKNISNAIKDRVAQAFKYGIPTNVTFDAENSFDGARVSLSLEFYVPNEDVLKGESNE